MAAGTPQTFGPAYIANSATNILNNASTAVKILVYQIRVSNKTGGAVTYTLYKGATGGSAGGTEITGLSESVPANSHVDQYFSSGMLMLSTDFLTGVASAASSLTIVINYTLVAV